MIKICPHCSVPFSKTRNQRYCKDCIGGNADYYRMDRYKLANIEFQAMYFEQDGACAVCQVNEAIHVDHDHACCPGKVSCGRCVRGLLCSSCNLSLGHFRDSKRTLARAIVYLEEWE